MQEATIVEQLREKAGVDLGTVRSVEGQAAILIERQQQVIDLLMKAVEPFARGSGRYFPGSSSEPPVTLYVGPNYMVHIRLGDLRRAREAKVEAEKLLNSTPSTAL